MPTRKKEKNRTGCTCAIHGSTVLRGLHHLDRGVVAGLHVIAGRYRNLRQANRARVGIVGRAGDFESRHQGDRIVGRHVAEADVDVKQRVLVPCEPTRL